MEQNVLSFTNKSFYYVFHVSKNELCVLNGKRRPRYTRVSGRTRRRIKSILYRISFGTYAERLRPAKRRRIKRSYVFERFYSNMYVPLTRVRDGKADDTHYLWVYAERRVIVYTSLGRVKYAFSMSY